MTGFEICLPIIRGHNKSPMDVMMIDLESSRIG